jgi:hypothetical protein
VPCDGGRQDWSGNCSTHRENRSAARGVAVDPIVHRAQSAPIARPPYPIGAAPQRDREGEWGGIVVSADTARSAISVSSRAPTDAMVLATPSRSHHERNRSCVRDADAGARTSHKQFDLVGGGLADSQDRHELVDEGIRGGCSADRFIGSRLATTRFT